MPERREMMTVHALGAHVAGLVRRADSLRNAGYDVRTHADEHHLVEALMEDRRRGCVVADLQDIDSSGPDLIEAFRTAGVPTPLVITDRNMAVAAVMQAVKAGVVDIMVDPIPMQDLALAIDHAFGLSRLQLGGAATSAHMADRLARLTDRERTVLDELLMGLSTKEIARDLEISPRTVEVHRSRLMMKMEARNLAHLFRMIFSRDDEA